MKIGQLVFKHAYKMLAHVCAVCGYVYTVLCEKHGTNAQKCAMAWVEAQGFQFLWAQWGPKTSRKMQFFDLNSGVNL